MEEENKSRRKMCRRLKAKAEGRGWWTLDQKRRIGEERRIAREDKMSKGTKKM